MLKPIYFNPYELNYLQSTVRRWYDYKGTGTGGSNFSPAGHALTTTILAKVQITADKPITFTNEEADLLRSLLYMGKQDYGRGSGNSVFEDTRSQVQQRSVQLNGAILAK